MAPGHTLVTWAVEYDASPFPRPRPSFLAPARSFTLFARRLGRAPPYETLDSSDALSLLANLVMAWNTMKMQSVLDQWHARRSTAVLPELIGRIAPTRTEGINLRGVFTFPIEQYRAQLLPSLPAAKSRAFGGYMTLQNAAKWRFCRE